MYLYFLYTEESNINLLPFLNFKILFFSSSLLIPEMVLYYFKWGVGGKKKAEVTFVLPAITVIGYLAKAGGTQVRRAAKPGSPTTCGRFLTPRRHCSSCCSSLHSQGRWDSWNKQNPGRFEWNLPEHQLKKPGSCFSLWSASKPGEENKNKSESQAVKPVKVMKD